MKCRCHQFLYQGVVYHDGYSNRPGSGAKQRYYAHAFYCQKCLEKRYEAITGIDDHSYNTPKFDAKPGPIDIVPSFDRSAYYP